MGWALLGASSLLLGALVAFAVPIPRKLLGFILAFGAGVLISAVAYELVEEAVTTAADSYALAIGLPLDEFLSVSIEALKLVAPEIGL